MGARILLVEDEANMARTLTKNLERAGHTVEHAPHGEAALARLGQRLFDMVVTDLKMPVMDGMQLLRALNERELPPGAMAHHGRFTRQDRLATFSRRSRWSRRRGGASASWSRAASG